MLSLAAPTLYALFVWWLGTGIVFYLDSLPPRTFRRSLTGASVVFLGAIVGGTYTAAGTSTTDAYVAFTCGVLVWGALEMSYFMGLISGPRKTPCPPGCSSWRRFALAITASLYHEVAIVGTAAVLWALTEDAANQIAFWAFAILWLMRWSAKLNVFFGVPNLNGNWLPEHLGYLHSYMGHRHMNYLFPISVSGATVGVVLLYVEAVALTGEGSSLGPALGLLGTLLALGVLEHWFLVLPLPDEALWIWAFKPGTRTRPPQGDGPAAPDEGQGLRRLALRPR